MLGNPYPALERRSQLLAWVFNSNGLSAPLNLADDLLAATINSYQRLMAIEIPPGSLDGPLSDLVINIRSKYAATKS
jgi:hypothetical protein